MTKSEASLLGLGMKDVKVQGISTVQLLFQGGEYVINSSVFCTNLLNHFITG